MDKKKAAAAAGPQQHHGGVDGAAVARAEAVRLWHALIDEDSELARALFFDALLRDARAEYDRKRNKDDDQEQEEEDKRLARVFEPWQPSPPAGPVMPPPPVERTLVLGLRAPPHLLARKHDRAPPSAAT